MIIACLNQKGGVGKTTITTNLTYALMKRGYKVLLADSDPQHSSMDWADLRDKAGIDTPFNVIGVDVGSMKNTLPRMKDDGYDFILIDGAPRMTDLARSAIIISDLVVMPMQPSSFDLWATLELRNVIEEAKIYKPELVAAVLMNRVIKHTNLAKEVGKELIEDGWTYFDTQVGQRQAYPAASGQGLTVYEIQNAKAAQDEINGVVDEILAFKGI